MSITSTVKKDLIHFTATLDASLRIYDRINRYVQDGTFFSYLQSKNPDIITHYHKSIDGKTNTLFVKNLLDTDDEELSILCFTSTIIEKSVSVSILAHQSLNFSEALLSIRNVDVDNNAIIHFNEFKISINPDTLTFDMKYDSSKHPAYIGKMLEAYFKKIFSRFSDSLTDPLFLR